MEVCGLCELSSVPSTLFRKKKREDENYYFGNFSVKP